jgi:hypothetical protein
MDAGLTRPLQTRPGSVKDKLLGDSNVIDRKESRPADNQPTDSRPICISLNRRIGPPTQLRINSSI